MPNRSDHDPDELLTFPEVAAMWRVSPRTIHRYVAAGKIAATRMPSGRLRIRRSDADAALRHQAAS